MANLKREKLYATLNQQIQSVNYLDAMKTIGALYYSCADDAREKEAELLFLLGEYERVYILLSNAASKDFSQFEHELYAASLAFTNRFNEVNDYLEGRCLICSHCFAYIQRYVERNNGYLTNQYTCKPEETDFFTKLLIKDILLELTDVYITLKDASILEQSGLTTSSIVDKCINQVKECGIKDPILDDIIKEIEQYNQFNPAWIIVLEANYIKHGYLEGFEENPLYIKYISLDDIVFDLNLKARLGLDFAVGDFFKIYLGDFHEPIKTHNPVVGELLAALYYTDSPLKDIELGNSLTIQSFLSDQLVLHYPNIHKQVNEKTQSDNICRILSSPRSQIAYKAAVWHFTSVVDTQFGLRDAGMLCLSYMRVIEIELNDTLIKTLRQNYLKIKEVYDSEKIVNKKATRKWKTVMDLLEPENNRDFTLGELYNLFLLLSNPQKGEIDENNLSTVHTSDGLFTITRKILFELLNQNGIEALSNQEYAKFISRDIRNKYRNPPAHTKYTKIETAIECRDYVNHVLKTIVSYMK